jgi:2-polyprenyl-6-methoxyphenol hydroxylase-like FAD-dependent oxidoreductase
MQPPLAFVVFRAARLEQAVRLRSGRGRPTVSARPIAANGDTLAPPKVAKAPADGDLGTRESECRYPSSYLHCGLKRMSDASLTTKCAIVGGGPAGMMLGFLVARAGVPVVVLEKHADFFRDFRGDTVHPSTLELIHELGLLEEFLKLPHQKIETLTGQIGAEHLTMVDFRHLPTRCKFVALMPQWDFLDFLARQAQRYKAFDLRMNAEATDLIEEEGKVVGLRVKTPTGSLAIRAALVVGCDGRHSTVRTRAGLKSQEYGAPMDVLWFRISRKATDDTDTFGHIEAGRLMVMLDRGEYWQCAYVIPKGGIERVKAEGLDAFRAAVVEMSPFLADRIGELKTWDDVKLLSVTVDRLQKWWRPGLICIGDAAHAMSPIGGVGINMAVQDAIAAANRLIAPLDSGTLTDADLQAIEERRTLPVRFTQWLQLTIQKRIISRVLESQQRPKPPLFFKSFNVFPPLRRIPARLLGIGIRPEHIGTPARTPTS